jgi:hypothetical protein
MPVATPSAAEAVPVAPMSDALVTDIIEAHAAGQSARSIAAERDLGLRRVQRKLALPESRTRVNELRAEHRKRENARVRKAEQRAREVDPSAAAERITGQPSNALLATRPGQEYPCLVRRSPQHAWRYCPQVGWNRWASFADLAYFGVKNPEGTEGDPGFGDPDYPRHPIGFTPPEQRVVCRMSRVTESGAVVTSPVQARDLEARIAEGWQRV